MDAKYGKLFTFSEFAALHQINKKTLMWYEQVGLFKPALVKDNGYRYYTYQQCMTLDTILMLRELDVSIAEIKAFFEDASMDSFYQMIEKKEKEIDQTIKYLLEIKRALKYQKKEIDEEHLTGFTSYEIIDKPKQNLILLNTDRKTSFEKQTELLFQEAMLHKRYRRYGILFGSVLPVESIYRKDFSNYTGVFLQLPDAKALKNCHCQRKGKYLRTYLKGDWAELPKKYEEILQYCEKQGILLEGYAYETGINDGLYAHKEDSITKIEIPIKEK